MQNGSIKVFGEVLEKKEVFRDYKNVNLKKVKKLHFFQRGKSVDFVQKFRFVHFLF